MVITFYFFLIIIQGFHSYYLTYQQRKQVRKILQSPDINSDMKQIVKNRLIAKYSWWAIGKATKFQQKYNINPNYCKSSEYIQSGLLGLCKSMKYYDGRVDVNYYAEWFIQDELYRCFTRSHPFGMATHYQMMNLKYKRSNNDKIIPYSRYKYADNLYNKCANHIDYINKDALMSALNQLSSTDKRIFCLRYDIDTLAKKRSHKEIAALMDFSISTVSLSIQRSFQKIKQHYAA